MTSAEVVVLSPLDELARRINAEHAECEAVAGGLVERWIAVGVMVREARAGVPYGQWMAWVDTNLTISCTTAGRYLRAAEYGDELRAHHAATPLNGHLGGISTSLALVVGHMPHADKSTPRRLSSDDVKEAAAMRAQGMTYKAIGDTFEVNGNTIRLALDPDARAQEVTRYAARSRRKAAEAREAKAAARALEQKRRWESVRKQGGNGSHVYGDIRTALKRCEAATTDADTDEQRNAWRQVELKLLHAEELAYNANHIERTTP